MAEADDKANWYWAEAGRQNGPVGGAFITRLVTEGRLGGGDMVWKEGMPQWAAVSQIPALMNCLPQRAVAAPPLVPIGGPVLGYQTAPIDAGALHQYVPDPNARITCPHCSVINPGNVQWCETCGMALPIPNYGPRIVDSSNFASTAAGQELQSQELHKQAKKAAGALLTVAIIQTAVVLINGATSSSGPRAVPIAQNVGLMIYIAIAGLFWGLYFWARLQPLPAAIVGLVLYVTLKAVDLILAIALGTIGNPSNSNGFGSTGGIGWLTIVIIVVLSQAISAGLKYRKMQRATAGIVV